MRVLLKLRATYILVAFCLAASAGRCASVTSENRAIVDLRPALRIGTRPISNYIFDKYYQRFVLTITSERNRKPDYEETKNWFEFFLTQQVIITEAQSLGYLQRPEVMHTVAQMERHMLMQPNSPLFKKIAAPHSFSDDEVKCIFAQSTKVIDGLFARCEDEQTLSKVLGEDFEIQSVDEQTRRVQQFQNRDGVRLIEARLTWPYEPFSEIVSFLSIAECGRWIRYRDPKCGTYLLFIKTVSTQPLTSSEHSQITFRGMLAAVDAQVAKKRIRLEQLVRAKVVLNDATSEQVLQLCRGLPAGISILPELPDTSRMPASFFGFWDGTGRVEVTFDVYRHWFNDEIIRRIPRSEADLRALVEDYIVQNSLLALAHAEGPDMDPQFAEDRRGFAAIQALDLYEREVLVPQLAVRAADIERFYLEHSAEFRQTTVIGLHKLVFATLNDAMDWIQGSKSGSEAMPHSKTGVISEYDLEASFDRPVQDLEGAQQYIFRSLNGTVFGPFPHGKGYLVFVKEKDIATGVLPLSALEDMIRNKLLRQMLEVRESELAVDLARRYKIEDQIDYARFGLSGADVKVPWHR